MINNINCISKRVHIPVEPNVRITIIKYNGHHDDNNRETKANGRNEREREKKMMGWCDDNSVAVRQRARNCRITLNER